MQIESLTAAAVSDVARLCAGELVLDHDAASLPAMLLRSPRIGLIARHDGTIVGACLGSVSAPAEDRTDGFIDLIVVSRSAQRQGAGRLLLTTMEAEIAARGCRQISIGGHVPHYAWPGIDLHYTAAICLADDLGYRRQGCEVNMDIDLRSAPLDTAAGEATLRAAGVEVRAAGPADDGPLQQALTGTWWPAWITELTAALRDERAGIQIAMADGTCVGFCAYGLNRPGDVGPIGTHPDWRSRGVKAVLLKRSLADQRSRGLDAAELIWAGPLSWFSRTVGATIGRAFWGYRKDLDAPDEPDWRDRIGLV